MIFSSKIHKWCLDQLTSDILQVVLMKIANVQEMVLLTNQSYMWYHISTHGVIHTRWWFHKWSSTLSDHQVKNASLILAQTYQVDDPCYDIGGGAPPIGIKVKDPICGISRAIQVVSFQYLEVSIKNAKFKPQLSTSMQAFASMRSTPFMKIDNKRREIV